MPRDCELISLLSNIFISLLSWLIIYYSLLMPFCLFRLHLCLFLTFFSFLRFHFFVLSFIKLLPMPSLRLRRVYVLWEGRLRIASSRSSFFIFLYFMYLQLHPYYWVVCLSVWFSKARHGKPKRTSSNKYSYHSSHQNFRIYELPSPWVLIS